ncbi:MAG: type I DNA topoisomerase [Patescibacteria group bacterium]
MAKNLVIVESPTKAKTISKFLSKDFKVESSFGHVRDLPEKKLGVDVDNNFEPTYTITAKGKKRVDELKKIADKVDTIYYATDEDREGEAISWHLAQIFKTPIKETKRITFHEITETAIKDALKNPRTIDLNLVDAQQARRILDRLVGYKLSPFLWKKIAKGLSAGRVQSVAVRLVVEREREIQAFKSDEYWEIAGDFLSKKSPDHISAKLHKISGKNLDKLAVKSQAEADAILAELKETKYQVAEIFNKQTKRNPLPPFTTSSLQQEANHRLGYSAKQTMMLAQQLYEGVEISGQSTGLITYMRTDSFNLSEKFISEATEYLKKNLGDNYSRSQRFKTKSKGAQEAHEAIRPTSAFLTPQDIENHLDKKQFKLYQLIWQRALASQMAPAIMDSTIIDITDSSEKYTFRANGQIIKFDGFIKIYPLSLKDELLPELEKGDKTECLSITPTQKFTQPPARYSDATLVKAMEEKGIGRPSTYAPTIATIIDRGYIDRTEDKRLQPKEIALLVNDMLVKHFPDIVDYDFTADMEKSLDEIAEGKKDWQPVIKAFYGPFKENLVLKEHELDKKELTETQTDEKCEKCGSPMVIKIGRYGKFLACSNYPTCKNTKKLGSDGQEKAEPVLLDEKCPECGSPLTVRKSRYGSFKGCSNYPTCKYIKKENIAGPDIDCPKCKEGKVVTKRSRKGIFYGCSRYPDCNFAFWGKPTGEKCPECGWPQVETKKGTKCSNKECDNS